MKRKLIYIIKKIFKVQSIDQLFKRYKIKLNKKIYTKKISVADLINHLKKIGIKKGTNIFIHSTWGEFYNYEGNINDFINSIIDLVGQDATIAMPAYPIIRNKKSIFNVARTPTYAGLIAETFRKYKGVKRSCHVNHSVCALGPKAEFLVNEHHLSETAWDKKSPYYKLAEINAVVVSFGLGKNFVGTMLHCADSILKKEYPYFAALFGNQITYNYKDYDGKIYQHKDFNGEGVIRKFTNNSHLRVIKKYFDKNKYKKTRLSNLTINTYDANYAINRIIELGKKGIVVYTKPDPKKYFK